MIANQEITCVYQPDRRPRRLRRRSATSCSPRGPHAERAAPARRAVRRGARPRAAWRSSTGSAGMIAARGRRDAARRHAAVHQHRAGQPVLPRRTATSSSRSSSRRRPERLRVQDRHRDHREQRDRRLRPHARGRAPAARARLPRSPSTTPAPATPGLQTMVEIEPDFIKLDMQPHPRPRLLGRQAEAGAHAAATSAARPAITLIAEGIETRGAARPRCSELRIPYGQGFLFALPRLALPAPGPDRARSAGPATRPPGSPRPADAHAC